MSLIVTQKPQYAMLQWAAERLSIPNGLWMADSRAVGVVDGSSIRAVMVLNHFSGEGCEATFVSDGSRSWATAGVISQLLSIPFTVFHMPRVVAKISVNDPDTQINALRIGFQFEARMRNAMPSGDDAVMFSMMRSGQPLADSPASAGA